MTGGICGAEIYQDYVFYDGTWMKAGCLVEMAKYAGSYQTAEHYLVSLLAYVPAHHRYYMTDLVNDVRAHYGLKPFPALGQSADANSRSPKDRQSLEEQARKFIRCIRKLREEGVLLHKYDYTWVMEVANQTDGMPKFSTPKSLIVFLDSHGIDNLPSEDSINKKQNKFAGVFPDWVFIDCDATEGKRRINVGKRFCKQYRNE